MAVAINFIGSYDLVKSTNFKKSFNIYNKINIPESEWKNFNYRVIIKEYSKIDSHDSDSLYNKVFSIHNGVVNINLLPEDTINFPVTKSNKPLILAIRVYSKVYKYSKEFIYKLNVSRSIVNNIY